jgi:hypothetical protein
MNTDLIKHLQGFQDGLTEMIEDAKTALEEIQTAGMQNDELLTVQEVADEMKVKSTQCIYAKINRKTNPLPAFTDGVTRIRRGALVEWIKKNEKSQP